MQPSNHAGYRAAVSRKTGFFRVSLAGGLVFLLLRDKTLSPSLTKLAEISGFSLILASMTLLSTKTPWPGGWALLPVTGTVLVLVAARTSSHWTSRKPVQYFGTRSYSLYLWHWPFVVALSYLNKQHDPIAIASGLVFTLLLGCTSYYLIENPARHYSARWRPNLSGLSLAAGCALVAMPAIWVNWQEGAGWRLPASVETVAKGSLDKNPRINECHSSSLPIPECTYGGSTLGAIVIGDSHAQSIVRTVETTLPSKNLHVLDWTWSSCPTVLGMRMSPENSTQACPELVSYALNQQKNLPTTAPLIILNRSSRNSYGLPSHEGHYQYLGIYFGDQPVPANKPDTYHLAKYRKAIIETACEFAKTRTVYLVRPIPEMPANVPKSVSRSMLLRGTIPDVSISLNEYHQRHAFVWDAQNAAQAQCNVRILDPLPYLCWEGRCHGMKNGRPLYYDDDHLSEYGARQLLPLFNNALSETAKAKYTPASVSH